MNLSSQLAVLLGVPIAPTEVMTYTTDGTPVVLKWDAIERWFFWRWADEKSFRALDSDSTRKLDRALQQHYPVALDGWERSAFNALTDAGLHATDPDYENRDQFGRKR